MMHIRILLSLLAFAWMAHAQSNVVYLNASSSGSTVYASAAIDWTGNSSWGPTAYHTYNVAVTITSPSGRVSSNSAYGSAPATTSDDVIAQSSLDGQIDDLGDFSVQGTYNAHCTVGGNFINTSQWLRGHFALSFLNYILEDRGLFCKYMVFCPNGVPSGNVCAQQHPTLDVEPDSEYGCLNYYYDDSLVITLFGVSECAIGGGDMSTVARNCS